MLIIPGMCRMLESHWSTIKEKLAAEAMRVSRVSSTLENQSLQPLQVFLFTDLEKRFQCTLQDGRKIIKEHTNARGLLQKAKEKYYGLDIVHVLVTEIVGASVESVDLHLSGKDRC